MTFEQFQRAVSRLLINDYGFEPEDAKACVEDLYAHYVRAVLASAPSGDKIAAPHAAHGILRRLKASYNLVVRFKAENGFFGGD